MGSNSAAESGSQFGNDTTHTKIFVGGLAWATQRDSIRRYFEQFGQILEAVVISDKRTGRSKGYGFVTFKDPDSATKACQNPYPVIDGRRTNCNLAAFGAQRNRPTTPHQRGVSSLRSKDVGFGTLGESSTTRALASSSTNNGVSTYCYQHVPQYALPYSAYGYPCYPQEMFAVNYYNAYGGQDFPGHYVFGSPNEVYFGCHPMFALPGDESSPRTNPKTTENPFHLHVSQQYRTETGPNTVTMAAAASEPAGTSAYDQNSVA